MVTALPGVFLAEGLLQVDQLPAAGTDRVSSSEMCASRSWAFSYGFDFDSSVRSATGLVAAGLAEAPAAGAGADVAADSGAYVAAGLPGACACAAAGTSDVGGVPAAGTSAASVCSSELKGLHQQEQRQYCQQAVLVNAAFCIACCWCNKAGRRLSDMACTEHRTVF